jgi:hypothetical protein
MDETADDAAALQRALWLAVSEFPFDPDQCYDRLMGECPFPVPDPPPPALARAAALGKEYVACPVRMDHAAPSAVPILSLAPSNLPSFTFDPTSPARTAIKRDLVWCEPETFDIRSVKPVSVAQPRHVPAFPFGPDGALIVDD